MCVVGIYVVLCNSKKKKFRFVLHTLRPPLEPTNLTKYLQESVQFQQNSGVENTIQRGRIVLSEITRKHGKDGTSKLKLNNIPGPLAMHQY